MQDSRGSWKDLAAIGLLSLILFVFCFLHEQRQTRWFDEGLSYLVLSEPSLAAVLGSLHDIINAAPPLYFVIGWGWAQAFGASDTSLLFFSSLGTACGLGFLWKTLRQVYDFWPALVGIALPVFGSDLVMARAVELRFYGWVFGLSFAALYIHSRLLGTGRTPRSWLCFAAAVNAALIMTHYFGGVYGALLLAAFVIAQVGTYGWAGVRRAVVVCAASACGWLVFLTWLPVFRYQNQIYTANKSGYAGPTFASVIHALGFGFEYWPVALGGMLFVAWLGSKSLVSSTPRSATNRPVAALLLWSGILLASLPLLAAAYSLVRVSIFVDRYWLIGILIWIVFTASVASRWMDAGDAAGSAALAGLDARHRTMRLGMGLLIALIVAMRFAPFTRHPGARTLIEQDLDLGYAGLPVICESAQEFVERCYRRPDDSRYFTVVDEQCAHDPAAGRAAPIDDLMARAIGKRYYPTQIKPWTELQTRFEKFLVIPHQGMVWFPKRIVESGEYDVKMLRSQPTPMYHVVRRERAKPPQHKSNR